MGWVFRPGVVAVDALKVLVEVGAGGRIDVHGGSHLRVIRRLHQGGMEMAGVEREEFHRWRLRGNGRDQGGGDANKADGSGHGVGIGVGW